MYIIQMSYLKDHRLIRVIPNKAQDTLNNHIVSRFMSREMSTMKKLLVTELSKRKCTSSIMSHKVEKAQLAQAVAQITTKKIIMLGMNWIHKISMLRLKSLRR